MRTELEKNVEKVLTDCLRNKFTRYKPESKEMPFHAHLLGKDRMALFSFIHSLNTSFGTTIFEPVAKAIAKPRFKRAETQVSIGKEIAESAFYAVDEIMNQLTTGQHSPDKKREVILLRNAVKNKKIKVIKPTKVDVLLETHDGDLFLFDIKSAKPNIGEFKGYKRTLLEWVGIALTENPTVTVHTLLAIPYNPYAPKPYERWTLKGLIDIEQEVKVAEEFWNFLGGDNTYEMLLGCFERVGLAMRDEIDQYFARFK